MQKICQRWKYRCNSETMAYKPVMNDYWTESTLERATRVGHKVYQRAIDRKIEWPKVKDYQDSPIQDPHVYTSLDDAFADVLQFMSTTTKQCKRFYKSCPESTVSETDDLHCSRFHTPEYTRVQHKNPLQRNEDVHLVVKPGTYAVTAGAWGTSSQQTHVVHIQDGNTVNMDFVL